MRNWMDFSGFKRLICLEDLNVSPVTLEVAGTSALDLDSALCGMEIFWNKQNFKSMLQTIAIEN